MSGEPVSSPAGALPQILHPGHEKFTVPVRSVFSALDAFFSILSLLAFAVVSVVAIDFGRDWPWWTVLPFWFTLAGSTVGFVYETRVFLWDEPYQLMGTAAGRFIQTLRLANLAPVFGSVYLVYCLVSYGTTDQAGGLILIVGAVTGYLLVLLLFHGPPLAVAFLLTLGFIAQLVLLWTAPDLRGGMQGRVLLTIAAVGLYATIVIGSQTPRRSTIFHLVGTGVVVLLFLGLEPEFADRAGAVHQVTTRVWLWLLAAVPAGAWFAFRLFPGAWAVLRSLLANSIWPLFYLIIAGGARLDRPRRLSEVYAGHEGELRPLPLLPYYLAHPRNLTHPVGVPCLDEALTVKVHSFGFVAELVKFVFGLASAVNRFFPFANIDVPLAQKPRMEPWSDGTEYWPSWLLKKLYIPRLGWFQIEAGVKGPGFQPTPSTAIDAYRKGQLLAFLVEYGIAGSFIEPVKRAGRDAFELDLSFLEKYETKPDYEPYGGKAYFEIDAGNQCLKLTHVRAPHSDVELEADPGDPRFRRAEDLVLASVYFYVVSGKHLVEIHMGLNLVEVALFNCFDAKQRWAHPVRLALYPHLFAHELAEELTTQNLLEDKAVFPQIFATTNSALVRHLNDRFGEYLLGRDEDFEHRERVLLTGAPGARLEDVLPRCSLVWEKEYAAIWHEYATHLVGAAYADDGAVLSDECVQNFYAHLSAVFPCELPARYDQFRTKTGLARFISDTMHRLIVRHEIYGTSGVRLALDPRINKVQVPKDGGPSAVDEWRSLACVAMATSRVRYTQLMTDFSNAFEDLENAVARAAYKAAFDHLQTRLKELDARYRGDGIANYETLRLLPTELDIGAGY